MKALKSGETTVNLVDEEVEEEEDEGGEDA
jgi:hypothetical protein